jgi:phage terminase Nu1 subunit (DNA packaging protein)
MSANEPNYPAAFFAKLFDVSERRIQQLAQDGIIPKSGRGKYPLLGTVRGYVKFLQERSVGQTQEYNDQDLRTARTRLIKAQADMQEIKIAREVAELIPAHETRREMSVMAKSVANTLDTLPDILERDCGLSAEALDRVQDVIDVQREQMFLLVIEDLAK